jgi:hypothetical protein
VRTERGMKENTRALIPSFFFFAPWSESASKLYRPSDRRFSAKQLPACADRGCRVVGVTDPSVRILSVF